MHARRHGRRRLAIPVLASAAVLAVCCSGAAVAAAGPANTGSARASVRLPGKWAGTYSGAFSGTFRLHWRQSGHKLRGSITLSYPNGTYSLTGSVRGKAITFGAVGAGATYTGSVSGNTMSGHYKTPKGGGSWSAHKTS